MKKFGIFLIFAGLFLVGLSLYQEFFGATPFLNMKEESDVFGPRIEVKKVDNINYEAAGGESFDVNKDYLEDETFDKDFYLNVRLGDNYYRMYFKYPKSFSLLSATRSELIFGKNNINISFAYPSDTYKSYIYARKNVEPGNGYYYRTFSSDNELTNVHLINVYEGNNDIFINKAMFMISELYVDNHPLEIDIKTLNKKIPDKFILDFYNNIAFQKLDPDFDVCKLQDDGNYICSFKLNNYDNSSKKKVELTVNGNVFKIYESDDVLIPSNFSLAPKDDSNRSFVYASFAMLYNGDGEVDKMINSNGYVEEYIDGRKFMVKSYANTPSMKNLFYEVQPSIYINIDFYAGDELYDEVYKTFLNFKVI